MFFLGFPFLLLLFFTIVFFSHVGFSIPEALGGSLGPVLNPRTHRNPVAIFTSNRNLGRIFVADEFLVQLFRRFGGES